MSSAAPKLAQRNLLQDIRLQSPSFNSDVMSVSMKPGAMALTVMPREANSRATDLVNPISPALLAA